VHVSSVLVLYLLSPGSTTLGVLWFIFVHLCERTFVGLIVKLIGESQISHKDFVFELRNLLTSF
jgi:hypothetical protein